TSSDPDATLPRDYDFTTGEGGMHTFTLTLQTIGSQTIDVVSLFPETPPTRIVVEVVDGAGPYASKGLFWELIAWEADGNGWHSRRR
ncbi:MAG TPA: hypothetical protein VGY77_02635, partial [Gemmataceae bacterium]|nr:hypothetical protein [Gemmataceae bacterium]